MGGHKWGNLKWPSGHEFNKGIREKLRKLYQLDNFHGAIEVVTHWLFIGIAMSLTLAAWNMLSTSATVLVYLLAVIQIGGRQRSLADVLHQAAHRTLAKNRLLNDVLGTVFSGYWVLQSLSGYTATHGRGHHGNFGDPDLDPDYQHLTKVGVCGIDRTPSNVWLFVRGIFLPKNILLYLEYLFTNRIVPSQELVHERRLRFFFLISVGIVVVVNDWLLLFLLFWVVPFITTQAWIGALSELAEHYPMVDCEPRVDILLTRNRHCSKVTNFFMGVRRAEGLHLVHHLFPGLPAWNCIKAHKVLMMDAQYRAVNDAIGQGWSEILLEIVTANTRLAEVYNSKRVCHGQEPSSLGS